jgi:hypothetical protein
MGTPGRGVPLTPAGKPDYATSPVGLFAIEHGGPLEFVRIRIGVDPGGGAPAWCAHEARYGLAEG